MFSFIYSAMRLDHISAEYQVHGCSAAFLLTVDTANVA